ncbi:MAG TPA: hypothetical protein VF746_06165 [Longimicrobium sp.]|jgi:hypothetical protein
MKHKLKIDDLSVETFVVSEDAAPARGTVRGFARPSRVATMCQESCPVDACGETVFVYSCGYPETQCPQ